MINDNNRNKYNTQEKKKSINAPQNNNKCLSFYTGAVLSTALKTQPTRMEGGKREQEDTRRKQLGLIETSQLLAAGTIQEDSACSRSFPNKPKRACPHFS